MFFNLNEQNVSHTAAREKRNVIVCSGCISNACVLFGILWILLATSLTILNIFPLTNISVTFAWDATCLCVQTTHTDTFTNTVAIADAKAADTNTDTDTDTYIEIQLQIQDNELTRPNICINNIYSVWWLAMGRLGWDGIGAGHSLRNLYCDILCSFQFAFWRPLSANNQIFNDRRPFHVFWPHCLLIVKHFKSLTAIAVAVKFMIYLYIILSCHWVFFFCVKVSLLKQLP